MSGKRTKLRQLERIYAEIPDVQCKGLCQAYCGPIGMTELESGRITERTGRPLGMADERLRCPLLTVDGRCSVYDVRPLICRLWGAEETMRCPHGCAPANGKLLSHEAGRLLRDRTFAVGGRRVGTY